ncbi:CBS domain-containing protein [Streptomyces sp. NPDC007872]|uniref:CBS domain-containing protein n=1 Tax=Streptomyces sp. NPDC007872 TaxID=3364782 RepID=UPI003694477A
MTPLRTQLRRTSPDEAATRASDHMTVEVALSVMAADRTGRLLVCDGDDRPTGLVTRAQLAAARAASSYTDRLRLRDVVGAAAPAR